MADTNNQHELDEAMAEQDKDKDKAEASSGEDAAENNQQPPANSNHHDDLGIAGTIAKAFITSPVTPMLLIASLLIGVMGLIFTPRQEDPKISVPMIDLYVSYPGASVYQVESLVTDPLERLIELLKKIRHLASSRMIERILEEIKEFSGEAPQGDDITMVVVKRTG